MLLNHLECAKMAANLNVPKSKDSKKTFFAQRFSVMCTINYKSKEF